MVYPRVHDPVLFEWEIDDTHDRYEYPRAWPSSEKLHLEFSILAAINALTASFVFLLILSLLRSKRVRSNVFNLYLLFIAIPDFFVSFLCFFTCAMSAPRSQFYSEWMCGFQSFYLNWAFICNAWLNGVVVFQIHRMLRHSQVRRRYIPPTHTQVLKHAALVYAYASFWGFLCGFNLQFLPHSSHLYYGFACMPMEYDRASTLFFWLLYLPMSLGVPLVFAGYVTVDIISKQLLPPTGKRRTLAMFLLRLCFLYFAIWLPFLILFLVGNFVVINPLIHWIGAAISHLQGFISALFMLTNQDIRRSFLLLVTCQPATLEDQADASDLRSSNNNNEDRSGAFGRRNNSSSNLPRIQSWILGQYSGTARPSGLSSSKTESEANNSMELLQSRVNRWHARYNPRSSDDLSAAATNNDEAATTAAAAATISPVNRNDPLSMEDGYSEPNNGNKEHCLTEQSLLAGSRKPGRTFIQGILTEESAELDEEEGDDGDDNNIDNEDNKHDIEMSRREYS